MSARRLYFHFDYISPYSYLAWKRLNEVARRHDLQIEAKPTLLAALLDHWGHKGPGEIAPKRVYMFKDCLRAAAAWHVPFAPPFSHPFNPLASLRATLLDMQGDTRAMLVTRLFSAAWAESLDVASPRVVDRICAEVGVPDALRRIQDPTVKQRLHDASDEAIQRGVLGVPTMIVDDEPFFGTDSFPHLERYLEGRDPVRPDAMDEWAAVPATAHRKRGS
jgi:2-hydroxychromene-2-carboxylate isomerase